MNTAVLHPSSGLTGEVDKAGRRSYPASTLHVLKSQLHAVFASARELGMGSGEMVTLMDEELRPFIEEPIRDGYATPAEGLSTLLQAEGGCVSVSKARGLFRKTKPVTPQAITENIRKGNILAYRPAASRDYLIPAWQFGPEGGVIQGLPEVLAALRAQVPGSNAPGEVKGLLIPFAFLLQADPMLGGRTPLTALRAGDVKAVVSAAEEYGR